MKSYQRSWFITYSNESTWLYLDAKNLSVAAKREDIYTQVDKLVNCTSYAVCLFFSWKRKSRLVAFRALLKQLDQSFAFLAIGILRFVASSIAIIRA